MGSTPVNVFLPQVTRLPITGPAPFNTLVCCTSGGFTTLPGAGAGFITRGQVRAFSSFVLQGFDQRVTPNFQHSTSGWLAKIGPSEEGSWLYAIDSIADAGFDPVTGRFFVDINLAVQFGQVPSQFLTGGLEEFVYETFVCSYVLVNEPPVSKPAGEGQARAALAGLQPPPGTRFSFVFAGTTAAQTFSAKASATPMRVANPVPASQLLRCRCECDCCRKGKCAQQKCGKQNCTCTCSCCQR
jgi:hypothetical protein